MLTSHLFCNMPRIHQVTLPSSHAGVVSGHTASNNVTPGRAGGRAGGGRAVRGGGGRCGRAVRVGTVGSVGRSVGSVRFGRSVGRSVGRSARSGRSSVGSDRSVGRSSRSSVGRGRSVGRSDLVGRSQKWQREKRSLSEWSERRRSHEEVCLRASDSAGTVVLGATRSSKIRVQPQGHIRVGHIDWVLARLHIKHLRG